MNINEKFGFTVDTPFKEKYGTVIEYLGEEKVREFIPHSIEKLKHAYENDTHFNSLPLKTWDTATSYQPVIDKSGRQNYKSMEPNYFFKDNPKTLRDLLVSRGITSYSVAECVCVLKECARRWVKEELEKEAFEKE